MRGQIQTQYLINILLLMFSALPLTAQSATGPKPLDLLKAKLETIAHGVSADWGVYIKSLDTWEEIPPPPRVRDQLRSHGPQRS